eukprot:1476057-Rhodomonas_salina.1
MPVAPLLWSVLVRGGVGGHVSGGVVCCGARPWVVCCVVSVTVVWCGVGGGGVVVLGHGCCVVTVLCCGVGGAHGRWEAHT